MSLKPEDHPAWRERDPFGSRRDLPRWPVLFLGTLFAVWVACIAAMAALRILTR